MSNRLLRISLAIGLATLVVGYFVGETAALVVLGALAATELLATYADAYRIVLFLSKGEKGAITELGPPRSLVGELLNPAIQSVLMGRSIREAIRPIVSQELENGVTTRDKGIVVAPVNTSVKIKAASIGADEEVLYLSLLRSFRSRFAADVVGLIYSFGPNEEVFSMVADSSMRFPIDRITPWVAPFFESGDSRVCGAYEDNIFGVSHFVTSPTGGFRSSIILEITNEDARPWRSLVWMGYNSHAPGRAEIERARVAAQNFKNELNDSVRIRELADKAQSAESQNKAKSDFIAHVSHDIRSPLNNVRTILALFEEEAISPDLLSLLRAARANCESIGELVEDILDYSRHQSGQIHPVPERIEVSGIIDSVISCFKYSAQNKGLLVSFDNQAGSGAYVTADKRHLKRIISNIFSNALKYTDQGAVKVQLEGAGTHWRIKIIDTGHGMSQEQIRKLFTPFTRFSDKAEGIGLGLAVTRILAQLNNIKVGVGSKMGEGSIFEIMVPVSIQEDFAVGEPQETQLKRPRVIQSGSEKKYAGVSVMLVDDDLDCTETLAKNLRRIGFDVTTSNNVEDAIFKLALVEPQVVISDYDMPNGGGARFISEVRRASKTTAILLLSGRDDQKITDEIKAAGANDVMVKPAEVSEIIEWIDRQIGLPWLAQDVQLKKAS